MTLDMDLWLPQSHTYATPQAHAYGHTHTCTHAQKTTLDITEHTRSANALEHPVSYSRGS